MGSIAEDIEAYGSPGAVAFAGGLARAFRDAFAGEAGSICASASPSWFDDAYSLDTLKVLSGDFSEPERRLNRDYLSLDIVDWDFMGRGDKPSDLAHQLEESAAKLPADQGRLVKALGDFVLTGPGRRDLVRAGLPVSDEQDAVHFLRMERDGVTRLMVAVGSTNGFVDIAYELSADGSVTFHPDAGLAEVLKDGMFPDRLPGDPAPDQEAAPDPWGFPR